MSDSGPQSVLVLRPRWQVLPLVFATILVTVVGFSLLEEMHVESDTVRMVSHLAVALFGLGTIALAWFEVRSDAVRFTADSVETRALFRGGIRRRADIIGVRQTDKHTLLLMTRDGVRPMPLPRYALRNADVAHWVSCLPCLER